MSKIKINANFIFPLLLLILFVLIIYYPVIALEYAWDDWELFINKPGLRLQEMVWTSLFQPILPGTTYLRPVVLGTFSLEFFIFGVHPGISHAINLFLHSINVVLVFAISQLLVFRLNLNNGLFKSLLAALIYALHPALIEPVAWVAGRFDLLMTFFVLSGIWVFLSFDKSWKRDIFITLCFFLAALSKEMAATMPLLLLIFFIAINKIGIADNQKKIWLRLKIQSTYSQLRLPLLIGIAGVGVMFLRYLTQGAVFHQDVTIAAQLSGFFHWLGFVGQTLLFYIKTTLWPVANLNPQHPFDVGSMSMLEMQVGISVLLSVLLIAGWLGMRFPWPGLMVSAWLISLLPVLNLIPLTTGDNIGHERFLTLPLAFFAMGVANIQISPVSAAMKKKQPLLVGAVLFFMTVIAIANIRITIPLWHNDFSLWAWAYAKHAESNFVRVSYLGAAIRYGQFDVAEKIIEETPEPLDYRMKATKALYLSRIGKPKEALTLYQESIESMYLPHKEVIASGIPLEDAVITRMNSMQWLYQSIFTAMAEAHLSLKEFQSALDNANIALFYAPYYPSAWMAKAFALYGLDRLGEAENNFAQAIYYFTPKAQEDAYNLRHQLLSQICLDENSHENVCREWKSSSGL